MRVTNLWAVGALILSGAQAEAAQFRFVFESTVRLPFGAQMTPLTTDGDPLSISVIVDNGADSAASQTWLVSETVSATLVAGGYTAVFDRDFFAPSSVGFTTDAAGALASATWFGTAASTGVDNFGAGARLFSNSLRATGDLDGFNLSTFLDTFAAWSGPEALDATPTPIPAPPAALLLGTALLGAAGLRRRAA